jgi:hypothetical protein
MRLLWHINKTKALAYLSKAHIAKKCVSSRPQKLILDIFGYVWQSNALAYSSKVGITHKLQPCKRIIVYYGHVQNTIVLAYFSKV